ncbi:uncharacterized protein HKW66_Vig0250080 [Vigna angularis]|uniref:Uncharacterized protein n=1 Tax=Phaseolus angularis TaxID=3914 RepID=A0A8T0KU43_PHAAN|nr:uncharacterized protein HKW66_Vig0250080 [Vigna angularis]
MEIVFVHPMIQITDPDDFVLVAGSVLMLLVRDVRRRVLVVMERHVRWRRVVLRRQHVVGITMVAGYCIGSHCCGRTPADCRGTFCSVDCNCNEESEPFIEICSSTELFPLTCNLVKFRDKVLIANMLSDVLQRVVLWNYHMNAPSMRREKERDC